MVHIEIKKVDCSNYATKADVRKATNTDTPSLAKEVYLTNLKSDSY